MNSNFFNDPKIVQIYKVGERITEPPARILLEQSGIENEKGKLVILDNACGTGVVTSLLFKILDEKVKESIEITCGDLAPNMVAVVKEKVESQKLKGVHCQTVDAQNTGLPDNHYTHIFTNFGIMMMPNPTAALNECFRILKPGGVCAFTTWQYVGWFDEVRSALNDNPEFPPVPDIEVWMKSLGNGDWHRVDFVKQVLSTHGFNDIKVNVISNNTVIHNPEEFADTFSVFLGHFLHTFWSESDCQKHKPNLRACLLNYTTKKYGAGKSFDIKMEAIVSTCRKP
eukprot:TRINITY_DN6647_c0_g1_i1.p1 TRINITY_DN6647_c0_g1~~TRINITY_DN6647_c0_g1_i1.p1  ORF type:complete len:284 (-),score=45.01 TRINITY_DN6647_c0_g1_i1:35-886(-)